MLTERLVRLTEDVLVGRQLPPDMLASYRARMRSDNSLRRRVYREGTLLAVWTGALFAVLIVVLAVSLVLNAVAPSSTATALVVVGFLGAFCLAGMAVHMVRYLVLLVVGLVRTGELIGASRQIRIGPDRPRTELVERRWFVALTTPTDVDLVVQAAVVLAVLIGTIASSMHA